MAIDGGRLLRAAPMAEFTAETGILTVEVEEGRDALAAGLAARGLRILDGSGPTDRTVRIALDGGAPFDLVRDTVADLGLPLVRMERGRHSLEDLFRDDVPRGWPGRRAGAGGRALTAGGDRRDRRRACRPPTGPTGSIYDIGYRGYDGPRLGRRHAFTTLFVQGLRATFGLGRSGRAKILPAFCLVLPAIVALIIVALNGVRLPLRHQRPRGDPGPPRHGRRGRRRSPRSSWRSRRPSCSVATSATGSSASTSRGRSSGSTTRWPSWRP